ncbi:MAG TPA: hypothetical protein VJ208_00980 [Candidatus Nanoarchaeia archaeon]|nr:hypothetical protein [Candidatus Nanoarchaeia archaeon]
MRIVYYLAVLLLLVMGLFGYFSISGYDIVSVGSGGAEEISANPDPQSEGAFFGDAATAGGEEAGAGTAGGGTVLVQPSLNITPAEFNIELAVNTNVEKTVEVKNLKTGTIVVNIRQVNLDSMIILGETSLTLLPNETKRFNVVFVALNKTGIFTGKIIVGSRIVPVSLNVRTKLLLFDSNIAVLNDDYLVRQGDELKTQVTLIPLGDETRLDVTLNYVIKDYDGKTYLTKSETLLVEKEIDFRRDFDTGILPLGQYVVGLELVYSGGVATSSAHFEVIEGFKFSLAGIVYYLIIAILIVMITIVILLIKEISAQNQEPQY